MSVGALRIPDRIKSGGDRSPPGLLPGFVSHVSHDLRSAASEANIAEIFVVKQQYAQKRYADND